MIPSMPLLNFTRRFEGLRLVAYWDNDGHVWTIAYGHTEHVYAGDTCTPQQAVAWLMADMANAGATLWHYFRRAPSQCQYDAFCDLAFNVGADRIGRAGIMDAFNAGDDAAVAAKFLEYGPLQDGGIVKRRAGERAIFTNGDYTGSP